MSNKFTAAGLLACALTVGVWAQNSKDGKPSPFSDKPAALDAQRPQAMADIAAAPEQSNDAPTPGAPAPNAPSNNTMPVAPPLPSGPAISPRAAMASHDPYPDDVAAINQADLTWRAAQNRLEELGSGCNPDGQAIVDQARDAKLKSVASYAKYYQDTIGYWTKSRDAAGQAEMSSRTDSAELEAHVNQLQLELQSVNRRKADLDRTFGDNHVNSAEEKAALDDLTRIQTAKQEQLEKARAALDQNKAGHQWVMKRQDYARQRLTEVTDLLQSTKTELYLYQQLYNAILYRHSLSCDREISRPIQTTSDWRDDLKRLSTGDGE
jgi:hypothetical protein